MKRLLTNTWHKGRLPQPVSHLLLLSLVLYTPAGECDEPDWPTTSVGSYDYRMNTDYFAQTQSMCCTYSQWMGTDGIQESCGDERGICIDELPVTDSRDRAGLKRDTWYFLSYQWAVIGVLYAMPESVSGWSEEQKDGYSLSIWWDNVTHPQMDSDDFYINYILNPYWGAAYFVRARERGYSNSGSFWYTVLLSSLYEMGAEALFENVSTQDMIVTPIAGSLVGMYFMNVRDNIRERDATLGYRKTKDKWLLVLTDPLGSLNRQFDKLFGWETELQIVPYSYVMRRDPGELMESVPWTEERVYGIQFRLRW